MGKLDAFKEIVQQGASTAELTWLRIGGPIDYLARPRSEEEALALLAACREDGINVRALGDGSNILVSDVGAPGLALQLCEPAFCGIEIDSPYVTAGAGAKLGRLATATASVGLAGLEGLIGVPGTVGAGVVTNVSTPDVSLGQWVDSARVATYDGKAFDMTRDEFVFEYRSSNLEGLIVLSARFRLEPDDAEALSKRLQKIWIARNQSMPELKPGEGLARLFKNPRGQSAAELVAESGFSGANIGGASVCESDANLVWTQVGCKSDNVKRLISLIQKQASERAGVELERELEIW
ncbi:MAG: FAD-binding protein [Thermoguttaceae bacterium]|nr:FAD-binding protein [Thermoguttaceae bacterium]